MNCINCVLAIRQKTPRENGEKLKFCNLKSCNKKIKSIKDIEIVRINFKNYVYCSHNCYLKWLNLNTTLI